MTAITQDIQRFQALIHELTASLTAPFVSDSSDFLGLMCEIELRHKNNMSKVDEMHRLTERNPEILKYVIVKDEVKEFLSRKLLTA